MANAIYPYYKEALLWGAADSALNGSGDAGLHAALVNLTPGGYTYSNTHQFFSDLTTVVGEPMEVTNVTGYGGLIAGDDVMFPALTGAAVQAIVLFRKNAGPSTTWRLVAYLDTGINGVPLTPAGVDVTVSWDPQGIVQL